VLTTRGLHEQGTIALPEPLYFGADGSVLGTTAIVMKAVEGESLMRRTAASDERERSALADQMADLAAAVHRAT
jgi:aminoglycoside phosphotransferase (APT) family kinase protein